MLAAQSWRPHQPYQYFGRVCKTLGSDEETAPAKQISRHAQLVVKPTHCFVTQAVEVKPGNATSTCQRIQDASRQCLVQIRDQEMLQQSSRGKPHNFPMPSTLSPSLKSSPSASLEELLLYLISIGVDEMQVMAKYPAIVRCNLQEVKSVALYLKKLGLKRKGLSRVINICPQILGRDVEEHLKPTVKFLTEEVGLPEDRLSKAISRCPRLLVCSLNEQLRQSLRYLQSLGFKGMAWVISSNPALLTSSIQRKLVPKLQFLQSLGISYEEAVSIVIRIPSIFNYSIENNLRVKHDYLINVMRRDLCELCRFPQFFAFSLPYRIRPRHELLSRHNVQLSLPDMLKMKDKHFRTMYTKGVPRQ